MVVSTFAILKPDLVSSPHLLSFIFHRIRQSQLRIHRAARLKIQRDQALSLYKEHEGRFYHRRLIRVVCAGPAILMELRPKEGSATNPIDEWRQMIGPSKFLKGFGTEGVNRETFRWKYALSDVRNSAHGADSSTNVAREMAIFNEHLKDWTNQKFSEWTLMNALDLE